MGLRLRVNEAIARSEANGKKVLKKDIAARLFEGASESAQQVNMTNLCNGTTKGLSRNGSLLFAKLPYMRVNEPSIVSKFDRLLFDKIENKSKKSFIVEIS